MRIAMPEPASVQARRVQDARHTLDGILRGRAAESPAQSLGEKNLPVPNPGAIHEWFAPPDSADAARLFGGSAWFPPLSLPLLLAWQSKSERTDLCRLVLIGPTGFLNPSAFERGPLAPALARAVFVDPANANDRALAFDLALRCPSTTAVIADGRGVGMSLSRRFQLAAGAGNTLGILLRPAYELSELSAAATRWRASPTPSPDDEPRWSVELLRCKGMRPTTDARRWTVRLDYETGDVRVVADAGDRPGSTERSADTTGRAIECRGEGASERSIERSTSWRTA